jgi:hypothetical protein
MNETINWRAIITWDDMTTVVEDGVDQLIGQLEFYKDQLHTEQE